MAKIHVLPVAPDGLLDPQAFEATSTNGLLKVRVRFGLTRNPDGAAGGGEAAVKEAFGDVVRRLREFADMLEASAASAQARTKGN